jgi:hypothetical protein
VIFTRTQAVFAVRTQRQALEPFVAIAVACTGLTVATLGHWRYVRLFSRVSIPIIWTVTVVRLDCVNVSPRVPLAPAVLAS